MHLEAAIYNACLLTCTHVMRKTVWSSAYSILLCVVSVFVVLLYSTCPVALFLLILFASCSSYQNASNGGGEGHRYRKKLPKTALHLLFLVPTKQGKQ